MPRVFFSGEKYNKRVASFYCLIIRVLYGLWGGGGLQLLFQFNYECSCTVVFAHFQLSQGYH